MINLETTYIGLKLKNPVIVSSSGLTNSVEKIKKLEENGAGAVVLKSLFEEQINHEAGRLIMHNDYPEAEDYIRNYTKSNSVDSYLKLIEEAKKAVSIPVIASINCISAGEWTGFAKKIQEAGADALELNVFYIPMDKNAVAGHYENAYFDLAGKIKKVISIPVAIKLGYHFTNMVSLVNRLSATSISGIVLFNRFYEPDIDIDNLKIVSSEVFSSPSDIRKTLRWVGILADKVNKMDIAASTGAHDGNGVIKLLLAGAKSVQVCSTLYKNGVGQLQNIIKELEDWMEAKDFSSIDDFRGSMSYKSIPDPSMYERSQFMKYFSNID